ncbi:MAG: iron uptake system protein EfeO [Nocardioides sp.]
MPGTRRMSAAVALAAMLSAALSACTENATSGSDSAASKQERTITVESSDDACLLSEESAQSGSLTFTIKNTGSDVTEFYLYGEDGERIVSEAENIGPGLSRDMVVAAPAGTYVAACKPGMAGDGIRVDFEVSDSGAAVAPIATDELIEQATERYQGYVYGEAEQLLDKTKEFVAAYTAGKDDLARSLYPQARTHWERIEIVAESFADLDPLLDAREADLEPGQKWTGWHRIEKDLWPQRAVDYSPLTERERRIYGDDLVANTVTLEERIGELSFTVDQLANGSRGLLEEVATGKITGEEEYWSRTDLWDFQANVDGAYEAFEALEPIIEGNDPELVQTLDTRFEELQQLLSAQRRGKGFRGYDELTKAEIKKLADAVNALSEPLSEVTAVVVP